MEKLKPLEHKIKALFFRVFERTLNKGNPDFRPINGDKIQRVLFLRPEKLGDMVISFPVFDGLKKFYPHLKISILGSPRNFPIIKNDPRFENIFMYTKNIWRDLKEFYRIRSRHFDCVVDMICDDSVTALFLSQFLAPGKPRIGVGKMKFKDYYDFNFDHRLNNTGHIIENTLKLLEAFGIDTSRVNPFASPYLSSNSKQKAQEFFDSLTQFDKHGLKIGLNLSAGSESRAWALNNYKELADRIGLAFPGSSIILFTIPSERARAVELRSSTNTKLTIIPDNLELSDVCAIIRHLDVLISPDTSLVHIARSFQVSVVGLYTRFMKNYLLWRPFGQESGSVISGNDHNIHDISADQVFESLVKTTALAPKVKS